ncbi:MAG TPA: hypothetical protein PLA85_03325 [Micropepsaceae bacterium]|nr:hypothetical protein [Micropepsaceae bacterium]
MRCVLFAALSMMAAADAAACVVPSGVPVVVARVEEGALVLANGVRLLPGTIVLRPDATWPATLEGAFIRYVTEDDAPDRHGRLIAQIFVARDGGEVWLQAQLIDDGAALVMPRRGSEACAAELLMRAAARGNDDVQAADAMGGMIGRYAIVEGVITRALVLSDGVFLDFGEDWRTDFSVFIARGDMKRFGVMLDQVRALEGRSVRVRGFVGDRAGPQMRVTSPRALELLP